MGSHKSPTFQTYTQKWLQKVNPHPPKNLDPPELVSNSQSAESTDSSEKATTPSELALVPQSTWLPSSNTWPLRSSNSLETLPETTRKPGSSHDTCNSPSETTKS